MWFYCMVRFKGIKRLLIPETPMRIHAAKNTYKRINDSFDNTKEVSLDNKGTGSTLTYFVC